MFSVEPKGADEANRAGLFTEGNLSSPIVFDHVEVWRDYFHYKKSGERLRIPILT
jgi:hypothetical protein